jgi:hypothetical protein
MFGGGDESGNFPTRSQFKFDGQQATTATTNFQESGSQQLVGNANKITRWKIYSRAAYIIQRAYRKWISMAKIRFIPRHNLRHQVHHKANINMNKVLDEGATFEDKLELWRAIVELRRARHEYSSDSCLKAMFECDGDLAKALIRTGNKTFAWR